MHVVPEKDNREKATSVSYEVAGQPSKNCYNLAKYDGSKHTSTEEEYYRKFRYNDWGGRRCPVSYPDEQYRGSPLSTIFGIWKKSYYAKFALVGTT